MAILLLAPHPDDEALGAGGTLAKYAAAGERVIVVIFSSGQGSHPLHKEHVITRTRKEEALAAHKILNVQETVFLMLEDTNLKEEVADEKISKMLLDLIKNEKPSKIFMPALDDLLPDHRAVSHLMLQLHSDESMACPIYTYGVWNHLSFLKRAQPRLVVDISAHQRQKLEAIRAYKSQWVAMYHLVPFVLLKSFFSGLRYGYRWVEVFVQVR